MPKELVVLQDKTDLMDLEVPLDQEEQLESRDLPDPL